MADITPFSLSCFQDNHSNPSTRITATTTPVPSGKRFVVEHVSGYFVVGTGFPVDQIWATDGEEQRVYLPTHFASRDLNFGGQLGTAKMHQFGSPARMYIEPDRMISLTGDANIAGLIRATAVGYLVDA